MRVLVTGAAGFIGSFTCHRLLDRDDEVIGVDNLNDYYDVGLKEARLVRLTERAGFTFERADIGDATTVAEIGRASLEMCYHFPCLGTLPRKRHLTLSGDLMVTDLSPLRQRWMKIPCQFFTLTEKSRG